MKNPHDLQKRINLRRRHLLEKQGTDQQVHKSLLRFRVNYCEAYRVVTWGLVWGSMKIIPTEALEVAICLTFVISVARITAYRLKGH